MKRKIVFLSSEEYSKDVLDNINECFDKGYEIEQILNAICGYYIILILKDNINCDYASKLELSKYNLIEENDKTNQKWVKTTTKNIEFYS